MSQQSTIKNLFIVRHGHAQFEAAKDFDRPLSTRGIASTEQTASFIANQCRQHNISPSLCITSAALRTRQTAEIICRVNGVSHIDYDDKLYATTVSQWLQKLSQVSTKNIIIVGHNPTFSQMLRYWCGVDYHMQPANCALITLEIRSDGITYPASLHDFYQNEQTPGAQSI